MKHWGLRILSALLTFTLGTSVAILGWRYSKLTLIQPIRVPPKIDFQLPPLPPPQKIEENTEPTVKADEIMKPHPVSISPYEIKRLVNNNYQASQRKQSYEYPLEPIWEQLGLHSKDDLILREIYGGACRAEIVTLELDGKPGMETMLILYAMSSWRFLIFKQFSVNHESGTRWDLLGYIDAYSWYVEPTYRIITAGTKRWLVVNEIYGHGSGFGSDISNWYEVSESGVTNVLYYQSRLGISTTDRNPGIIRKTNPVKAEYKDGIYTIVLQSSTSYEGYLEQADFFPLWTDKRKVSFIKGPRMQGFFFDPLHSEMNEKELDPSYGDGVSLTDEEFLKYNYLELVKIADGKGSTRKEWLRSYLDGCDDSALNKSLQKALEGARP
jgi:hypothetical protein